MTLVQAAFKTVEQAVTGAEQAQSRSASKESKERVKTANQEAKEKLQLYTALFKQIETAEKAATKATEKAAKERAQAAVAEAKEKVNAMRMADAALKTAREQATKEVAAEAQKRAAIAAKEAKEVADLVQAGLDKQAAARKRFAGIIGGAATTGAARGLRSAYGVGAGMVNSVLALGGGFGIADSVQKSTELTGTLADIANSGFNPASSDPKNRIRQSPRDLEKDVRTNSIRYGYSEEQSAGALGKFTKVSGDLNTARTLLGPLAELSRATASNLDDMADAAGNVAMRLGDSLPPMQKNAEIMKIMRGFAGQGKTGAIEISDLTTQLPKIIAATRDFSGSLGDNMLKLGAVAQMARSGGGAWNGQSTGTAITALAATFGKGARRNAFHAMDIQLGDEKAGGKIDIQRVMTESVVKASSGKYGAPAEALSKLYGSTFALRSVGGLATAYSDAAAKESDPKKKEAAGKAAVENLWKKYIEESMMTEKQARDAATARMQENDMKMAVLSARFNESVANKLLPELMKLLPVIEKMLPQFVGLAADAIPAFVKVIASLADFAEANKGIISTLAENPIGTIIAFEVTKSIGQAAIGEGIKKLLNAASPAAAGLLAVAAAAWAAKIAIDAEFASKDENQRNTVVTNLQAGEEANLLNRGGAGPEEIAKAKAMADKLAGELAKKKAHLNDEETITGKAIKLLPPGSAAREALEMESKNRFTQMQETDKALDILNAAVKKASAGLVELGDHAAAADPKASNRGGPTTPLKAP